MSNENFKYKVLDILGIGVNINPPKEEGWQNEKNPIKFNSKWSNDEIADNVSKMIDNKIRYEVDNAPLEEKDKKLKELENSIKTFTLDDILRKTKGFKIGSGFEKAKQDSVKGEGKLKTGREYELSSEKNNIKYDGKLGIFGETFSVRNAFSIKDIKEEDMYKAKNVRNITGVKFPIVNDKFVFFPGDIILVSTKEFNNGISQNIEKAYNSIYGGKKNPGYSDAVKDITGGEDISIKCYVNNIDKWGSIDAISNYDKKIKLVVYNYFLFNKNDKKKNKSFNNLNNYFNLSNKKDIKSIAICRLNKEQSGIINKRVLYSKTNTKRLISKDFKSFENIVNFINNLNIDGINKETKKILIEKTKEADVNNKEPIKFIKYDFIGILNNILGKKIEETKKIEEIKEKVSKEMKNFFFPKEIYENKYFPY